ncbi:MAG: ferrochelatase [Planctomycetota bacterium]|nr:MAG: ferrochelatase [Planctomycetota bacterium]
MCDDGNPSVRGETEPSPQEAATRRAVLLINLGTPDAPTVPAVRQYLRQFLSDPEVIRLPKTCGFLQKPLGRMLARFCARRSAAMYRRIWSERGSPLRCLADDQVRALQAVMPRGWHVFGAMRYGQPSIPSTLRRIVQLGIEELIVVPMYPQYSGPTTGTALREVHDFLMSTPHSLQVTVRNCWFDDHGYITAQARLLREYARAHGLDPRETFLLFSTHGLPASYIRRGDPYAEQVTRTVSLVTQQMGWPGERSGLSYQSRFGPTRWLQPYTDEFLKELLDAGERRILVCPISFTTDCLETLEEIDGQYRELVEAGGGELYLAPALNTFPPFIRALKEIALRGPRPMRKVGETVSAHRDHVRPRSLRLPEAVDALEMVGLSIPGALPDRSADSAREATEADLRAVKRSACEMPDVLGNVCSVPGVREAFLWNTCHRFECYLSMEENLKENERETSVGAVRRLLFEQRGVDPSLVRRLDRWQALSHMVRTAAGFHSVLPGEQDVLDQLRAALRLARCAESAGARLTLLAQRTVELVERLREETPWGAYAPDYAEVVLRRVAEAASLDLPACRVVVIGGSTTSAGVLRVLREAFDVPGPHLTLFYRGHRNGGHLSLLRKALGTGRRVRVQTYRERSVREAIAAADVVIFGVDRSEPILDGETMAEIERDGRGPLVVVDFNTFGSTRGIDAMPGVRVFGPRRLEQEAAAYSTDLCASESFREAYRSAEAWIEDALRREREGREAEATAEERGDVPSSSRSEPASRKEAIR